MVTTGIEEIEKKLLYENDSNDVPPNDIVSYNELRSCADLFRMSETKILEIQPDFQRDVVWSGTDQTRFIDSLIKQLPIPSMCFAFDYKAQRWMVIDGLQRIATIVRFLKGADWKLSALDDIDPGIAGKSAAAIKTDKGDLKKYYTRVENLSVPINVLRCDFSKKDHMEYLFTIFHRLNAGGLKLNNQEIRNCIYNGPFNDLLKKLDQYGAWRKINKMQGERNYRFTKQELLLRFFALYDRQARYSGHISKFLNEYMHDQRDPGAEFLNAKADLLKRTADLIWDKVFAHKTPSKLPNTVLEAVLIGVAKNLDYISRIDKKTAGSLFKKLLVDPQFSEDSLSEGLSKKPKVEERLSTAIRIFSGK